MCDKCNDTGILGIRNGDNDIPCDCNEINTIAVQEPLSELAQLRLELAECDNSWKDFVESNDENRLTNRKRFSAANMALGKEIDHKLHLLFDEIDRLAKEKTILWAFYRSIENVMDNYPAGSRLLAIDKSIETTREALES